MANIAQIMKFIDGIAPFESAMDWDNSGLLVESDRDEIEKVTVCLDITADIVNRAANDGTQLIISHHPVIFSPLKRLAGDSVVRLLAKNNIAAICAHTNLDIAKNGVNAALAKALGLENVSFFSGDAIGVYGDLKEPMDIDELCRYIKKKLSAPYAGLVRASEACPTVSRLAMCSGAGADFISEAKKCSAQAFLTGEAKHNELIESCQSGVNLIVAGHFATERVIVKPLAKMLGEAFRDCEVICADDREPLEVF